MAEGTCVFQNEPTCRVQSLTSYRGRLFKSTRLVLREGSHHTRETYSGRRASALTYIVPIRKATLRTGEAAQALSSLQEVTLGFGETKQEISDSNVSQLVNRLLLNYAASFLLA